MYNICISIVLEGNEANMYAASASLMITSHKICGYIEFSFYLHCTIDLEVSKVIPLSVSSLYFKPSCQASFVQIKSSFQA